jgi:hypothetical protein
MSMKRTSRLTAVLGLTLALSLAGCAAKGQSTRLSAADLTAMSTAMAQSLADSAAFASRRPDSEPWFITINKVQNLSSDVMTDSEQWLIIARLRGELPLAALREQKNVHFVIPAERVAKMRADPNLEYDERFGAQRRATHEMSATFRSITRATARDRTDYYYAEFEIVDLAAGAPVWSDKFEFKRSAKGHVWD